MDEILIFGNDDNSNNKSVYSALPITFFTAQSAYKNDTNNNNIITHRHTQTHTHTHTHTQTHTHVI